MAIDWDQFNENFQYYDKEIIVEIINLFIEEYDGRINKLQKNIDEKDFVNLAFNAHSFKSVISNYMSPKAYELACKLEDAAKTGSENEISVIFPELMVISKELLLELKDYIK